MSGPVSDEHTTDQRLRDDVYAQISIGTGWDDDIDELVDARNDITDAIMRLVAREVRVLRTQRDAAHEICMDMIRERDRALACAQLTLDNASRGGDHIGGVSVVRVPLVRAALTITDTKETNDE